MSEPDVQLVDADELEATRAPFVEHLTDLRVALRNAILAVLVCAGGCLFFAQDLYAWLRSPLELAWHRAELGELNMYGSALQEPFMVYLKVGLFAGLFVASPVVFHQIWSFIGPGLHASEKRVAIPFAICSALLFVTGGAFCYFVVLPAAFDFFLEYASASVAFLPDIGLYFALVSKMLVAFGLAFELPLLVFFLSYAGIVSWHDLWKFNKYFVPLAFLLSALLTPPDLYSQILMAVPLVALYNLSIGISWMVGDRKAARLAREASLADSGDEPEPDERQREEAD